MNIALAAMEENKFYAYKHCQVVFCVYVCVSVCVCVVT